MPVLVNRALVAAIFSAVVLSACATLDINVPAVTETPTGQRLPGKIIWRDLLTDKPAQSQRFYGELFGWTFEKVGAEANLKSDSVYTLIRHRGKLIGGMIDTVALNGRNDISQWIISMSVADVDAAVFKLKADGGKIVTPPTNLQSRGRLAIVADAQGALLALLETRDGDPLDEIPEVGGFLWDELWTVDIADASAFYADLAGLQADDIGADSAAGEKFSYRLLKSDDQPRVGIMRNPLEGLNPVWVSYLRVESPAKIASRVAALGGRIIVEAQSRPLGGEVAFVAGPSGAGIALQTWPIKKRDQEN